MTKRLMAKVGEYEKNGETKGEYVRIGVILQSQHGEYALIDPSVNLAGVLIKQRMLNPQKAGTSVLASIFTDDRQQGGSPQQQRGGGDDYDDDIPF